MDCTDIENKLYELAYVLYGVLYDVGFDELPDQPEYNDFIVFMDTYMYHPCITRLKRTHRDIHDLFDNNPSPRYMSGSMDIPLRVRIANYITRTFGSTYFGKRKKRSNNRVSSDIKYLKRLR
jgi:hypothetical protein